MSKIQKKKSTGKKTLNFKSPFYVQLFYDIGTGFSEELSFVEEIYGHEINFFFDLKNIKPLKGLRFDPINIKCILELSGIYLEIKNEEKIHLDFEGNFFLNENNILAFETDDPNILVKVPEMQDEILGIGITCELLGTGNKSLELFKSRNATLKEVRSQVHDLKTNQPEFQNDFFYNSIRKDYEEFIDHFKIKNDHLTKKAEEILATNKIKETKLQNVQFDFNQLTSSYTSLMAMKDELNNDLNNKNQVATQLNEKLTKEKSLHQQLKIELENKEKEMNSISEKNEIFENEVEKLKSKLKSSQDSIKDLETLKSIFERENKRLESLVSNNEKRLSGLLEQIQRLQNQLEEKNQHIINIEGFLHEKDSYVKILESKKEGDEAKLETLSKEVNIKSHHLENVNHSIQDLKKSLSYKLGFGLTAPARWLFELTKSKPKTNIQEAVPAAVQPSASLKSSEPIELIQESDASPEVEIAKDPIVLKHDVESNLWTLKNQIEKDNTLEQHPKKKYSVLFISPHLPDYDTSSGGKRATRMIELMTEDYDVYLYTLGDRPQKYIKKLEEVGAKVLKSPKYEDIDIHTHDYQEIKDQVKDLDAIIYAWYTTYFQSKDIIRLYPKANVIFDSVDVHWIREERLLLIDDSFSAEGVATNKRNEVAAYDRGNIIWAVTKEDGEHIKDEIPSADVRIVSNIHESEVHEYVDPGTNKILFLGGYKHTPNISAVKVLVEEIFPIIRASIPDAELILAGSHATDEIKAYGDQEGVDFRGFIDEDDLSALYVESFITVIPLLAGAGIKGKICEAISHMLPIATNDIGNEGINLENEVDGLIANDHKELAQLVINAMERKYDFAAFNKKAQTKLDLLVGPQAAKKEMFESITPPVSICVVTWNRLELVKRCIESIIKNTIYPNFKILVYSNGCTDGTQKYLTELSKTNKQIQPILSDKNEVFVIPNNNMMMESENDVVLVNNDTYLTKGWLTELQKSAYSRKDIGISGSKILYPDGKLQEFGSELYQNYSGNNIGKNDDPNKDQYHGEVEVGYVSGCSMYITRKTINRIGVFDIQFHPCYCEDSDLAYTAWEHGIASVVNSKSIIFHDEGGTSGTDTTNGFKAFQDLNFHKFYVKHRGKINRIDWGLDSFDLNSFEKAIAEKFYSQEGRMIVNGTQLENTYSIKFQGNEVRSFRDYTRYIYKMNAVYNKRFILERRLAELHNSSFNIKTNNPLTDSIMEMSIGDERAVQTRGFNLPNYRDSLYETKTRTTSRLRSLFKTISLYKEEEDINEIYFSDNISGIYDYYLRKEKKLHYSFDETFFGVKQKNNKKLIKGLSNIELEDESVELVIHNELLHFTHDYKSGLSEMFRILKSDGVAVISIPFLLNRKRNAIRAAIDNEGDLEHFETPVYYNNNLLCYQLFGWEFFDDCKKIGFKDVIGSFSWSIYHGILGNDVLTIVLKK